MQGIITRGVGGFYYALDAQGQIHQLRAQAKLRRAHLKPMVGDQVEFEPGTEEEDGWLKAILPRKSQLARPPVANIDTVLVVIAAAAPEPDLMMADRLLLAAREQRIEPVIAVNKGDIDPQTAEAIARQYRGAGADVFSVCARTGEGIEALRARLRGHVHAVAGQSGAGKSTLLNALYGFGLQTGDVSHPTLTPEELSGMGLSAHLDLVNPGNLNALWGHGHRR